MHAAAAGHKLGCFSGVSTPFHQFTVLNQAEKLWQQAEDAAAAANPKADPDVPLRIRVARLPLRYVWLARWDNLRRECTEAGGRWPLPESRTAVADAFATQAAGVEGKPWTRVTHLNESGLTLPKFLERLATEPK
jgi:hypothetical protein